MFQAADVVAQPSPLMVAIVGPESCGKTTLAQQLVEALHATYGVSVGWVPEYAREYFAERAYDVTPDVIDEIAIGQHQLEQEFAKRYDMVICDTTVLNCKIWAEVAYGKATPPILDHFFPHAYALTILTAPDIPWEPDPLRTHPTQRDWLFTLYHQALLNEGVTPLIVKGDRQTRLMAAMESIATLR